MKSEAFIIGLCLLRLPAAHSSSKSGLLQLPTLVLLYASTLGVAVTCSFMSVTHNVDVLSLGLHEVWIRGAAKSQK